MKFKLVQRHNNWLDFEKIEQFARESGVSFTPMTKSLVLDTYCSHKAAEKALNKIESMDSSPGSKDYWKKFGALGTNFHFYIEQG